MRKIYIRRRENIYGEEKPINYSNCTEEMKLKTKDEIIEFLFGVFDEKLDYELREYVLSRKEASYKLDEIKSLLALKLSNKIGMTGPNEVGFNLNTYGPWQELMEYVDEIYAEEEKNTGIR